MRVDSDEPNLYRSANPDRYIIGAIRGDCCAPILLERVQDVISVFMENPSKSILKKPIEWKVFYYGATYDKVTLEPQDIEDLKTCDQLYQVAIGDPTRYRHGEPERGLIIGIREGLSQIATLRPIVLPPGIETFHRYAKYPDVDFDVIIANKLGTYTDRGRIDNEGEPNEVGIQESVFPKKDLTMVLVYAARRARQRNPEHPKAIFAFKRLLQAYPGKTIDSAISELPDEVREIIQVRAPDTLASEVMLHPEVFKGAVILADSAVGDIYSDLFAPLQGGLSCAPSANIDPTGKYPNTYEPVHGTAPDLFYSGETRKLKPEASLRAASLMLQALGEDKASRILEEAVYNNLRDPNYRSFMLDELTQRAKDFCRKAIEE